jgi:diketogulonate reductase-like aldo/keto reductase
MNNKPIKTIEHRGIKVPAFFYGTAWKEERTEPLVTQALDAGFVGFDTANQRKHYYELAVGKAVQQAIQEGKTTREALFIQTKFTYTSSQDQRLPYDPKAKYEAQVQQSVKGSLEHFKTTYLDSYLLHGPFTSKKITKEDWEVWRTMEQLQRAGTVRLIGVSNVNREQLELLLRGAQIKPSFVQNRCYASTQWEQEIRGVCQKNDIIYQGFSLLTANKKELQSRAFVDLVQKTGKTPAQVVFRFAQQLGMLPLTGTSQSAHMTEDLALDDFSLTEAELTLIENLTTS